jgi:hypothetical protein
MGMTTLLNALRHNILRVPVSSVMSVVVKLMCKSTTAAINLIVFPVPLSAGTVC